MTPWLFKVVQNLGCASVKKIFFRTFLKIKLKKLGCIQNASSPTVSGEHTQKISYLLTRGGGRSFITTFLISRFVLELYGVELCKADFWRFFGVFQTKMALKTVKIKNSKLW